MQFSQRPTQEEKVKSWQLFDQIAGTYDLTNRVLSARQDVLWRRKLARYLPQKQNLRLLDLATGTADQILHLFEVTDRISEAVGLDMSEGMLEVGRKKTAPFGNRIKLVRGDATNLPFEDQSFDVITMSFGIRNVPDVPACLREMRRVLKPQGKALVLEFSLPEQKLMRDFYLFYFRRVLPKLGGLISGNTPAYSYLNNSVENFPYGESFLKLMDEAGFAISESHPLTLGIASLYEATVS